MQRMHPAMLTSTESTFKRPTFLLSFPPNHYQTTPRSFQPRVKCCHGACSVHCTRPICVSLFAPDTPERVGAAQGFPRASAPAGCYSRSDGEGTLQPAGLCGHQEPLRQPNEGL